MKFKLLAGAASLAVVMGLAACTSVNQTEFAVIGEGAMAGFVDRADVNPNITPRFGEAGLNTEARNLDVDPGDDFFAYANGAWYEAFEIPAEESTYGAFTSLRDLSEARTRVIIEDAAAANARQGSNAQKVGDFYNSFMDTETIEAKGLTPLQGELDRIAALSSHTEAVAFVNDPSVATIDVWGGGVTLDQKNPDQYVYALGQAGLGLPDRDYYLADRFAEQKAAYEAHIARMMVLTGVADADAASQAAAIVALETRIAEAHWTRAESRDTTRTYNEYTLASLSAAAPGYDWAVGFEAQGVGDPGRIIVRQDTAMPKLAEIWADTDLETLKAWFTYHMVDNHAAFLPAAFDEESFSFYGKVLGGREEQRERFSRGVGLVNGRLGDAVGELYVERYFPPDSKAQMDELVENLRVAYGERIDAVDWMGEETKAEAREKLAAFRPKVGYPTEWRDYSDMQITEGELIGNIRAARLWAHQDNVSRLGKPTNKDEWFMTPQTVNAYYNPVFNEIVFPAAILQPPFFDPLADPAINYGAIGGVIGHEMGHGFDDQGSRYDSEGVLRNWWTDEDRTRFQERTAKLVAQYDGFSPLEGFNINGQLSLGENTADLSGVEVAYRAYKISLNGEEAPVINGLTGDQRFFLSWAQVWRSKYRDEALKLQLARGPHSPPYYRVNGVVRNVDAWYEAFGVTEDDDLYLPPEERVKVW